MLALQILTAALTISFAKANPLAVDVRNWENPSADGNFKREELDTASPASHYAEYVPRATETSLTYRYYQERATCLDQFVWYCSVPAAACINAIPGLPTPLTFWSLLPCVIAAACGGVTVMLGALCCNGIIKNCDKTGFTSIASSTHPLSGNVMAALNGGGGQGDKPFTKATFQKEFNNYLKSQGSRIPTESEFNGMYNGFLSRAFCSFGPGEGGSSCQPSTVSYDALNDYLHRP